MGEAKREARERAREELEALGLVEYDEYGVGRATEAGRRIAQLRRDLEERARRSPEKPEGGAEHGE